MKMSELIKLYGDENVRFQNLDGCIKDIDYHHKKGTTIRFGTDAEIGPNGMKELGLVIWLDRKKFAEIMKKNEEINS